MKPVVLSMKRIHFIIVFISYLFFASIFGFAYRFAMNPDGISELRLAGYIAEGQFQQSVSSGYSPFITWLYSPFLFLGFDGLTAARITIALCGGGLLFCCWLLARRFVLPQNIRFIAGLITAPLIAFWTIQFISSDILFAALTVCYIYLATDPDIITKKKVSFFSGVTGGFSYLAHHYALPFFLVHFPVLLLIRGYIDRHKEGFHWKKVFISWGMGITGLLIIVSVWVGIVSARYGHLTISIKGGAAHAIMGPSDIDRRHPFFVGGLFKPRDAYAIHVFEDPSEVVFKTWSPFESKQYFIHQLKVIKDNVVSILNHFVNQSPFFTYFFVVVVIAFMSIAFLLNTLNEKKKFLYAWIIMTFSVYCSGFILLIARSPRRFYSLMLIFLILSFHFMEELKYALTDLISDKKKNILAYYLILIMCGAFALKPCVNVMKSIKHILTTEQVNPYREIAEQINTIKFPAPYASIRTSQKPTTDYYITYYLKKQLLGRPLSKDVQGITEEIKSAGGKSLLIFDNPDLVDKFKPDNRYIHLGSVTLLNSKRYDNAAKWIIAKHEILTGWDRQVNIFTLK